MKLLKILVTTSFIIVVSNSEARLRAQNNIPIADIKLDSKAAPQVQSDYIKNGYINVTLPPYNADKTGKNDSTSALRKAIYDGMLNNLVTYLPLGTYLVSESIDSARPNGLALGTSDKKFGFMVRGEIGLNGELPTIKAKDNSDFTHSYKNSRGTFTRNVILDFRMEDDGIDLPPSLYSTMVKHLNIDVGNNPQTSGIALDGAQNTALENLNITGQDFYSGVLVSPGSGGSATGIKVTGGDYGVTSETTSFRPSPSLHGLTLNNQKIAGFYGRASRGSFTIIGAKVTAGNNSNASWAGIVVNNSGSWGGNFRANSNLNLVDTVIETNNSQQVGVVSHHQEVFLTNTYIKAKSPVLAAGQNAVSHKSTAWTHFKELAFDHSDNTIGLINGADSSRSNAFIVNEFNVGKAPDTNYIEKHIKGLFDFGTPYDQASSKFEIFNILDFGATPGNNSDDDSLAITSALNAARQTSGNAVVFIPRGHFEVRQQINVPNGIRVAGAANNISVLEASTSWHPTSPTALLKTNTGDESLVLQDFCLLKHEDSNRGVEGHKYITALDAHSSNLVILDLQTSRLEYYKNSSFLEPFIVFNKNSGGRVFNINTDDNSDYNSANKNVFGTMDLNRYRAILIDGAKNLLFYQLNIEHRKSNTQFEIKDSEGVHVYGFSYESPSAASALTGDITSLMWVSDSNDLSFLGGSGIYTMQSHDSSIIKFDRDSDNYRISNFSRQKKNTIFEDPIRFKFFDDGVVSAVADASIFLVSKGSSNITSIGSTGNTEGNDTNNEPADEPKNTPSDSPNASDEPSDSTNAGDKPSEPLSETIVISEGLLEVDLLNSTLPAQLSKNTLHTATICFSTLETPSRISLILKDNQGDKVIPTISKRRKDAVNNCIDYDIQTDGTDLVNASIVIETWNGTVESATILTYNDDNSAESSNNEPTEQLSETIVISEGLLEVDLLNSTLPAQLSKNTLHTATICFSTLETPSRISLILKDNQGDKVIPTISKRRRDAVNNCIDYDIQTDGTDLVNASIVIETWNGIVESQEIYKY